MKLAPVLISITACASSATKGADSADPDRRGAFIGMELGVDVDPATTPPTITAGVAMPDGVVRERELKAGAAHVVIGKRGSDAIVFLTDDDGTVTDSFTLPAVFPGHGFTSACSRAGVAIAIVPEARCANGVPETPGVPTTAWGERDGKLVEVPTAGMTCDCYTTEPE